MKAKEYIFKYKCNLRLWLLTALLVVMHGYIQGQQVLVTYSTEGDYKVTLPCYVTSATGHAYGGGGGGGGAYSTVFGTNRAGGGGGGGYSILTFYPTSSQEFSIKVGAGGAGGYAGSGSTPSNFDGKPGGATTISLGSTTVTANGGNGGLGSAGGDLSTTSGGGNGGTGTYKGANGTVSNGGGGAGAGGDANAQTGGSLSGLLPGGGNGGSDNNAGNAPGGGGGGSVSGAFERIRGSVGGVGRAIIVFNYVLPVITGNINSYCEGDQLTLSVTYPCSSVTYTWKRGGTVVKSGIDASYTVPNVTATDTGNYTVECSYTFAGATVTASGGASASGSTVTFTSVATSVTVNTKPIIDDKSISICSEGTFTILTGDLSGTFPTGTTTYTWSAPSFTPGTITGGTSGSGSSITGTLTNLTNIAQDVTYVVTPSANGCTGAPFNVVVTVNPRPNIQNKTATVCSGVAFGVVPTNGTPDVVPSGTLYNWVISPTLPTGITADLVAANNQASISGTLTLANTITTPQVVTYVVTPKVGTNGCPGTSFTVTVTVNPKQTIENISTFACSGDHVNITPNGITNATYTWTLSTITGGGALDNPTLTSGPIGSTSIDVGTLTNLSTTNEAIVTYNVIPNSTQGDCLYPFTLTVIVRYTPQIIATKTTINSGDTLHLRVNYAGGAYTIDPNNQGVYVDVNGLLYTDVESVTAGIPTLNNDHSPNEGIGGNYRITYTTTNGCVTSENITVIPRKKTPATRWDFNGTCPADEELVSHSKTDSTNIKTPWNPTGIYFANYIVWDSLVVAHGGEDIPINRIKWYADPAGTQFIRNGGDPLPPPPPYSGEMVSFWQNLPQSRKVYYATIAPINPTDSCESHPIPVVVDIREFSSQIPLNDFVGYVQPTNANPLDLLEYLNLNLDAGQTLEWYATEEEANARTNKQAAPAPLDAKQQRDTVYWLIRTDKVSCDSKPTPFRVQFLPMPMITITPRDTLVCPGEPIEVAVKTTNTTGTTTFKIKDVNTGTTEDKTLAAGNTYTFTVDPLSTTTYQIVDFSDENTPLVNASDPTYGIHLPLTGYFSQALLGVITTEISKITPASGPTAGGTYTGDPNSPINPTGTVTISGSGFAPSGLSTVEKVFFGGVEVTTFDVIDDHTIECIPPAHLSGYVTVAVTTECTTATITDGYRYDPISISSIGPNYAPVTGGTTIVIKGTGLLAPGGDASLVTVTLAGRPATIVGTPTDTQITCITGSSTESKLDEIVINNGAEIREFPETFTYYPVKFIENGKWSEPHRWKTQTADHILPFPGAVIEIDANCEQDMDVDMDSITVNPSKGYTLDNGRVLNAKVFTLKDNASFINENPAYVNMNAIQQRVEHLLTEGRNWYISSPVQGGDSPTIESVLGSGIDVNFFDEEYSRWLPFIEQYPLYLNLLFNTTRGYVVSPATDIVAKFSGKFTDGNVNSDYLIAYGPTPEKKGFNLVGNPFPSYWRWTADVAQQDGHLYSTIWYRTVMDGVYVFLSYNASGGVGVAPGWEDATQSGSHSLGYIPPMQAFWVRLPEGQVNTFFTFTDADRSHADHPSNIMRSTRAGTDTETRPLLRLVAGNDKSVDETVIYADPQAKKEFDTFDSDKFFNNDGVEIFSLPVASTRQLVINGLPDITAGTEIPIGFQADAGGSFRFRAREIQNMDTLNVFLIDKWRQTEFDLRSGGYYDFTASSVPVTDRFSIVFRSAVRSGISDPEADGDHLHAYSNQSGEISVLLQLRNRQGSRADVSVFDITSRKVTEEPVVVGEHTILQKTFPEGVYILRAGKCSTKVMVRK